MKPARAALVLVAVIAALAAVATIVGTFSSGGPGQSTIHTVRGESVVIYGRGIYRHDARFFAAGNRGSDLVTLVLAIPLLVGAGLRYRRGSVRAGLLLAGVLAWFAYLYASLALGGAYNSLFLVYIALFSASTAALGLTLASLGVDTLAGRVTGELPRRRIAALMLASGAVTAIVWLAPILAGLAGGSLPKLYGRTTNVTDVLDLGIITPGCFVAGALLVRRDRRGYVIASLLLTLLVILAPAIAAQTAFQLSAGESFSAGEVIGPLAGFIVLAVIAVWALLRIFSALGEAPRSSGRLPEVLESGQHLLI
jgi:hypothetical protein